MKIYLLRHGHAVKRAAWEGWDDLRPLTLRGERQARGLQTMLRGEAIGRVCSSPAVRCHETVEPIASDRSLLVELDERLGEDGNLHAALELLDEETGQTGEAGAAVLVCGSGALIRELLGALEVSGLDAEAVRCQKGSAWVLERRGGSMVGATYLPPHEIEGESAHGRRLAVLDIGSASMSLLVADIRPDAHRVEPVLRERAKLTFGSSTGPIGPEHCERAVKDACAMQAEAESVGCEEFFPIATAGLRHAPNGQQVADQIGAALGTSVRMLTGTEEARLVYAATRVRHGIGDEPMIAIDLGGGSLDLASGRGSTPSYEASEALGVSLLHATHVHTDPMADDERQAIRGQLKDRLAPHLGRLSSDGSRCIAAGGTVRALARLAKASRGHSDSKGVRGLSLSRIELGALAVRLCGIGREERLALPTVRSRRADLLPTGALILVALLEQLELAELTVSDWGLREGVLLEAAIARTAS